MDTNLNRSDDYQGFCGLDSWGPWKNYDFTNCFREAVIDAGIPLLYTIGSKCILILAYVKYKRQKSPIYEPLISGQTNSSYGSIGSVDSEETSITNDADSESTLLTNEFPKNKMFDWCRLLFGMSMFTLFCFFVIFRWREYDENKQGLYLITSPIIEGLIWSYASLLAYINLKSQYRNQFYLRKHLDILYFITFGRYLSPEVKCSLYDQFMFSWINPLLTKGFRKTLNEKDVYEMPNFVRASNVLKDFRLHRKQSFLRSMLYTFRKELCVQFFYSISWSVLTTFAPPFFLRKILLFVQNYPNNGDETQVTAYLYVIGLFLGSVVPSLCFQQALFIGRQLGIKTQAIIIGEIYSKSLSRKDTTGVIDDEETKDKTGKITNLMSVDATKVSEVIAYLFYIYCFPLQIIISILLLYLLLGVSALMGVLTIIITYPLPALINQRFETIHKRLMKATDKRMGLMNELLQAIRIIKFFAWEDQFYKKIIGARENELKEVKSRLMQWVYMGNVWMCLPLFIMLSVFWTYTKLFGNELTATVAFTALALFNNLRHALDEGPSTIVAIIQARVSIERVEKFLIEPELKRMNSQPNSNDPKIGFKSASFQWFDGTASTTNDSSVNSNQNSVNKFTLFDMNIEFPVGELSIICGPTGSGKTSLLMALLGELECISGQVFLPREVSSKDMGGAPSGIAYVAQTAWLQNATIKDNILFGLPFDEDRYNKVLNTCALNKDLEIFEFGDKTEIGEKGITLSGGQKQRIALARAVYSQAKIIIMDDCLSAVDSHTAKHIYEKCLLGDIMEGRTRILVTHHVGLCLRGSSKVVVMKNGRIIGQGTPSEVLSKGILEEISLEEREEQKNTDISEELKSSKPQKTIGEGDGKLMTEEEKAEGVVDWKIYKIYFKSSDWWIREWTNAYSVIHDQIYNVASALSSIITSWSFTFTSQNIYNILSIYPSSNISPSSTDNAFSQPTINLEQRKNGVNVDYYLGIYILIGLLTTLLGSLRTYWMFMGSLVASRKLHSAILDKVLKAKLRFFDTTPIGRILNRFSKDMEVIDQTLSPMALFLIYSCVATASVIFAISTVMPQFLIAGIFITALYVFIGAYYLATSRDLKRIESVTRSPIYASFGETIVGVSTIRAFGAENKLMKKMLSLVDGNNRPFIYNWACNRWLHTRVDLAGGLVSFATGIIIIYQISKGMDPGLAGFALAYALNFTGHIIWVLRMYAMQEMNMNSVYEYMNLMEEPARIIEGFRPPPEWPFRGEIKVNNLIMQYAPDNPPVLKDVSFQIKPSEKVGIVGRTGSGKSTLAVSFFRFMEPTSGQIVIDGVDISTIGLFDLRSRLTIIPQDPVLFSGTLRSNLDPFGVHNDVDLWNAIRRAHLIDEDKSPSSQSTSRTVTPEIIEDKDEDNTNEPKNQFNWSLDALVNENGSNFSQGQRQLIALARALARRSKVIIMDEATASVDFKTDKMIQETIRTEFKDSTLLCIAHRLRTVVDYDKILVLDGGRVVEFDHPYSLIRDSDSLFRSMCERSGEFTELIEVAKAKYDSDHV
ncbi:1335_t:CDS:10 [Funneliformis caledonium]|uniref:1335_t:CDS:1 n=1 Tax=Funneliformis caledonium TaxID=1117310 RepID=A0A9N8ZSW4_9GLOM|nr:1335_t:CDS:10 [Funneliformis caledonium]